MSPTFRSTVTADYAFETDSPAVAKEKTLPNIHGDLPVRCGAAPPTTGAFEVTGVKL